MNTENLLIQRVVGNTPSGPITKIARDGDTLWEMAELTEKYKLQLAIKLLVRNTDFNK